MKSDIESFLQKIARSTIDAVGVDYKKLWIASEFLGGVSSTALFVRDSRGLHYFVYDGLDVPDGLLVGLREEFVRRGREPFSQFTLALDPSGKFNLDFGYDDVSDLGRQDERQALWVKRNLGKGVELHYDEL